MTAPSAAFLALIDDRGIDSLVVLAEIALPDGTVLFRALHPFYVTFGGQEYVPDNGAFEALRQTIDEDAPSFRITFQNIADVETGDPHPWTDLEASLGTFNGTAVTIRVVSRDLLADADAKLETGPWYVSGYELDRDAVVLSLGSPFDSLALETLQPSIVSMAVVTDRATGEVIEVGVLPTEVRV